MSKEKSDPGFLAALHSPEAIKERLERDARRSYVEDFVYGAMDGTVTTFAVVSAAAGAELSDVIVVIIGLANVAADGFSMAVGNFLSTRSSSELLEKARRTEETHIAMVPEGEREEVRQIFARKGFSGDVLETIVETIAADKKRWVDTMLREELGMSLVPRSPWKAAFFTFVSFAVFGMLPLAAFLFRPAFETIHLGAFLASCLLTGVSFTVIGALKSRLAGRNLVWGAVETLFLGLTAALIAYSVGVFLKGLSQ